MTGLKPQHFAVSVRHKNSGKALLFFCKTRVKIPENTLRSQAESKSCLQQIYAPVFIMRQMLSPFSRMRPAFEDAANIQFSRYRVCLKHHKTQEALCLEFKDQFICWFKLCCASPQVPTNRASGLLFHQDFLHGLKSFPNGPTPMLFNNESVNSQKLKHRLVLCIIDD